ncbi:hypothetical protein [Segetibacter aerophilus]|uniref:Uncharacterized protein n=1 Tax=Segetibacter aerophilus TaxID=670293 RepID=A0A512BDZ3_9BACT|nr:hypothetical protein [Segetibacter aerophilus]GEO10183.1 hypothetical protein SAE01_26790 [Segetibacter aerophilus]
MSFYQTAIKKFSGKSTVFVTAAAFATLCSAHTVRQGANFSGDWTLNTTKSELGEMAGRVPTKLKVTQSADAITTERTSSFNGEERKTTEKITLDGKESENVVFGTSKKKSIAKWADNGQTLNLNSNIAFERDGQTMEIKGTENWKLSDGGKTLSIESTSVSTRGSFAAKAVYEKS